MKHLFLILLALVLFVAPVYADGENGGAGAFDNSDVDLALSGKSGFRLCLNTIAYDASAATDDISFYLPTGDTASLTTAITAAETDIVLVSSAGIATDAVVMFVHPDGRYAETKTLTSLTSTAAVDYAYPINTKVYELAEFQVWASVGTDPATLSVSSGFLCTPRGMGIATIIEAGVMTYMSGFYAR